MTKCQDDKNIVDFGLTGGVQYSPPLAEPLLDDRKIMFEGIVGVYDALEPVDLVHRCWLKNSTIAARSLEFLRPSYFILPPPGTSTFGSLM